MPGTHVALKNISVAYENGHEAAVSDCSLSMAPGEVMVLLGPSGCGKTTLLRTIAGLIRPATGDIYIGGECVTNALPKDRHLSMLFQSLALLPHMTVLDQLALWLHVRGGMSEANIYERVREVMVELGIASLMHRLPYQLSGGQQQRVALGARVLIPGEPLVLLDEPLSSLDVHLQADMRELLGELFARIGSTVVYVTHNQEEAAALADRVAVMRDGRIEQVGTYQDVYTDPATRFVAEFVGGLVSLPHMPAPGAAHATIRPDAIVLGEGDETARVVRIRMQGATANVLLTCNGVSFRLTRPIGEVPFRCGDIVPVAFPHAELLFFAEDGTRVPHHDSCRAAE